jgi:hypothetical protein
MTPCAWTPNVSFLQAAARFHLIWVYSFFPPENSNATMGDENDATITAVAGVLIC